MLTACSVLSRGWPCNPFWCKILHGFSHMCSDLLGQTRLFQLQRQQVCLPFPVCSPSKSLAQGAGSIKEREILRQGGEAPL